MEEQDYGNTKSNGEWITDDTAIQERTVEFFTNLYTEEMAAYTHYNITGRYPRLTSDEVSELSHIVTKDEVYKAFFNMGPLKAPGPDGFHAIFYQKFWNVVGDSVFNFVKSILEGGRIP